MGPSDRALELARKIIASHVFQNRGGDGDPEVDVYALAYLIDTHFATERDVIHS